MADLGAGEITVIGVLMAAVQGLVETGRFAIQKIGPSKNGKTQLVAVCDERHHSSDKERQALFAKVDSNRRKIDEREEQQHRWQMSVIKAMAETNTRLEAVTAALEKMTK